ncbi:MAG: hypothetical protein AB7J35_22220 [Dehalococcoidia bacterium]
MEKALLTCTADMTRIARFALLSLGSLIILLAAAGSFGSARAMAGYTVSIAPTADTVPVGQTAAFRVRVEGQTASLPSFNFNVEGGSLAGVASIDPTAANVAEGTVFVTRESEGTVRLDVTFGGEVLASGQARFARVGDLDIAVNLNAGIDAAARTWRFEVLTPAGQVVASLSANTSGDAPHDVVRASNLPLGFYTVRQVLGGDTATTCDSGAFYRVLAPTSAQTTIELASPSAAVSFEIAPCPGAPDLEVLIPIDTVAPSAGIVGDPDVLPGETPISEVRGARQEGPGDPLPPALGNTAPGSASQSLPLELLLILAGITAILLPVSAWSVAAVRGNDNR